MTTNTQGQPAPRITFTIRRQTLGDKMNAAVMARSLQTDELGELFPGHVVWMAELISCTEAIHIPDDLRLQEVGRITQQILAELKSRGLSPEQLWRRWMDIDLEVLQWWREDFDAAHRPLNSLVERAGAHLTPEERSEALDESSPLVPADGS